ncbi:unnamed protein product, partial [Ectocarpus sp. 8 AP-2014]
PKGHTVVCTSGTCVIGQYKPFGGKTAHCRRCCCFLQFMHERLATAANIKSPDIGASIKPGGKVALKSESVNREKHGKCDMAGTKLGEATRCRIEAGKVMSTKDDNTRHNSKH